MAIAINGSGTITGISQGGLNDNIITQSELANTGVAGNGPAFSVGLSVDQTVSSGVYTKIAFNSEKFDTNGAFDSTTNYRFQPAIAGYYQINLVVDGGTTAASQAIYAAIYKNGSVYCLAANYLSGNYYWGSTAASVDIVYLNGTTDYVEGYGYIVGGGTLTFASNSATSPTTGTKMSGVLVRAA